MLLGSIWGRYSTPLMVIPFNLPLTHYGGCGCSDLSNNQLTGDIPASIGNIQYLEML